ncbi:CopD family protein [Sphingobacterium sp. MYb382]|uniref:CopD family protein n=1 Tax=Sphingobacterium sp. MYb382 TaxID=2745278 RepID=UPI00309DD774
MKHQIILIIHLLSATIWVGGHLLLAIRYLPTALKHKDTQVISNFEKKFEPLGLPALLLLVITGLLMAYTYGVDMQLWFSFSNPIEKIVSIKLVLLFVTLALALHARLFIIPKLSPQNIVPMAFHILLITAIGVAMLVLGASVRFGGL